MVIAACHEHADVPACINGGIISLPKAVIMGWADEDNLLFILIQCKCNTYEMALIIIILHLTTYMHRPCLLLCVAAGVFGAGYFKFWIILSLIWSLIGAGICIFMESRTILLRVSQLAESSSCIPP